MIDLNPALMPRLSPRVDGLKLTLDVDLEFIGLRHQCHAVSQVELLRILRSLIDNQLRIESHETYTKLQGANHV